MNQEIQIKKSKMEMKKIKKTNGNIIKGVHKSWNMEVRTLLKLGKMEWDNSSW